MSDIEFNSSFGPYDDEQMLLDADKYLGSIGFDPGADPDTRQRAMNVALTDVEHEIAALIEEIDEYVAEYNRTQDAGIARQIEVLKISLGRALVDKLNLE